MSLWTDNVGVLLADSSGVLFDCSSCPCTSEGPPEGMSGWWKADGDLYLVDGVTPPSNGDKVWYINDMSGNGYHWNTWLQNAYSPYQQDQWMYKTGVRNSLPALGNNWEWQVSRRLSSSNPTLSGWTLAWVGKVDYRQPKYEYGNCFHLIQLSTGSGAGFRAHGLYMGYTPADSYCTTELTLGCVQASTYKDSGVGVRPGDWFVVVAHGGSMHVRVNGAELFTDGTASPPSGTLNTDWRMGYLSNATYEGDADNPFPAYFGECLLYPSELSGSAIAQLESYLMTKWAISSGGLPPSGLEDCKSCGGTCAASPSSLSVSVSGLSTENCGCVVTGGSGTTVLMTGSPYNSCPSVYWNTSSGNEATLGGYKIYGQVSWNDTEGCWTLQISCCSEEKYGSCKFPTVLWSGCKGGTSPTGTYTQSLSSWFASKNDTNRGVSTLTVS